MPMVRAMRMLNAIEAGTTTGAQLQTLLTDDPGRLAELNVLLGMRGQARRMAASSTAMTAVIASSTAMTAVIASSTAMTAVAASSTAMTAVIASSAAMTAVAASSAAMTAVAASSAAMTAVIASSTAMTAVIASSTAMTAVAASSAAMTAVAASSAAMTAVFASSTAKLAVYNSDTALAAMQANPAQVQTLIAAGTGIVTASTAVSSFVFVPNGTRVILLRRWNTGVDGGDYIGWARGSSATGVGNGPTAGGRNLNTQTATRGSVSGTYTSTGGTAMLNDATANFVSAANGLQREYWNAGGATLFVTYALVGA